MTIALALPTTPPTTDATAAGIPGTTAAATPSGPAFARVVERIQREADAAAEEPGAGETAATGTEDVLTSLVDGAAADTADATDAADSAGTGTVAPTVTAVPAQLAGLASLASGVSLASPVVSAQAGATIGDVPSAPVASASPAVATDSMVSTLAAAEPVVAAIPSVAPTTPSALPAVPGAVAALPGSLPGTQAASATRTDAPAPSVASVASTTTSTTTTAPGAPAVALAAPSATAAARPAAASGVPADASVAAEASASAPSPLPARVVADAASTDAPVALAAAEAAGPASAAAPAPQAAAPAVATTASAAPATDAAPRPAAATPTLTAQVSPPVVRLVASGTGEHTIRLTVTPESLGPILVRARVSADGSARIDLVAPDGVARDALQQLGTDLRRDLAGAGFSSATLTILTAADGARAGVSANGGDAAGQAFSQQPAREDAPGGRGSRSATPAPVPAPTSIDVPARLDGRVDVLA
jgi:flagellar hook-length control protein FliK